MELVRNATYRLENRADGGRSLNVYGDAPTNMANVCLWTSKNSDICQQWIYKKEGGHKYFVCKGAPSLALDLFTGSSSTTNVKNYNAHVYAPSDTSYLEIEDASDGNSNYIQIRLANNSAKYLTANQNSNGSASGKDVNAAGNVYFYKGGLDDFSQDWRPVRIDGTTPDPEPGDDVLSRDVIVSKPAGTYLSQRNENTWTGLTDVCTLSRLKGYGCSAVAATMVARIMEKKTSITTKNLYDWGVWSVSDGYPWALWTQNKSSQLHFTFSDSTTSWSSAKQIIFDEITNNRPVIIWLKNDSVGGTHFVVGYGLKAGASRQNLQYDQIMVYNPDPNGATSDGTLKDIMAYNAWKNFGSVRKAIPN